MKTIYVYIESEPSCFTVGFYDPQGKWHPESDHATKKEASLRVILLNGVVGPIREPSPTKRHDVEFVPKCNIQVFFRNNEGAEIISVVPVVLPNFNEPFIMVHYIPKYPV